MPMGSTSRSRSTSSGASSRCGRRRTSARQSRRARTTTAYGAAAFDGVSRLTTTMTDALGRVRTTFRDARDAIVAVRERNTIDGVLRAIDTRYEHDPLGQLTRVVDAEGHATTATYD